MPEPFRRFENLLRLLTMLVLSMSALGLLLIPGRLGVLTEGMPVIHVLFLGFGVYLVGLYNQASIFIAHSSLRQKVIDWVVTTCLGLLSFL
jgi:ABC-type branched-subunit amino acid transport system permease subunit